MAVNLLLQLPLREILHRSKEATLVEIGTKYKRLTIRMNNNGVFLRDEIDGAEIGTDRQFFVKARQFILSKIDARNGAFGIVPPEGEGAIITGNFWAFDVNEKVIIPEYFNYYTYTEKFKRLCVKLSDGSTNRRYLQEDDFLNHIIYIPSIPEQQRIVNELDAIAAKLEAYKLGAESNEAALQALLTKAFWKISEEAIYRPMAEVAPLVRRPVEIDPDGIYSELGVRSFGRGVFHKPNLVGAALTWQKLFRVHQGDLVFSNIKAWEGAFAVANRMDDGRVGSHRYLTCVPIEDMEAEFIWFYLQTKQGIEKVQEASPGTADRNRTLGTKTLMAISLPVPSYQSQKQFCQLLEKARQARQLRSQTLDDLASLLPAMLHLVFEKGDT